MRVKVSPEPEYYVCKICYGSETEPAALIHPCKCSGSLAHVHEECLKTWLISTNSDLTNRKCELCRFNYSIEVRYKRIFSMKNLCKNNFTSSLFTLILFSMLCLIAVIIYFLTERYKKASSSDHLYLIFLIIGCSASFLIILALIFYIIKGSFELERVSDWRINEYHGVKNEPEELVEDKIEEKIDYLRTSFNEEENLSGRMSGRKGLSPKIMPLNPVPVFENRKLIGYQQEDPYGGLSSSYNRSTLNKKYSLLPENTI